MSERMSFSSDVDPDGKITNTDETIKQVGNKLSKLDFTNKNSKLVSSNSSSSISTPGSTPSPGVILNMQSSQHFLTNGGLNLSSVRLSASNSSLNTRNSIFLPKWEQINNPSSKDGVSYTFISYNVLAQAHLLANKYLYKKNKRQHLQWETRFIKLTNFFEKYPADIYCLQEVEKAHLSQYNSYFDHACMNYFYENRPGGKPDGCLIAYNPVAFTKLDHYRVDYSDGNPMSNVSDNVGQIAVFKVNAKVSSENNKIETQKSSDQIIIVVNTHIVYSPKNGHVKLWQIIKLLDSIRQVKEIYKDWNQSIVFSGDFNAVANSGLWSLIVDGKIDTSRTRIFFTKITVVFTFTRILINFSGNFSKNFVFQNFSHVIPPNCFHSYVSRRTRTITK